MSRRPITVLVVGLILAGLLPGATLASAPANAGAVSFEAPGPASRPGELVAITVRLPADVAAIDGRLLVAGGAAELVGLAPRGVGRGFMPVEIPGGFAFGAYDMASSDGQGTVVSLVIDPRRAGRIHVRVAIDAAANAAGSRLNLAGTESIVTLAVGSGGAAFGAPDGGGRPAPSRAGGAIHGSFRHARINNQDLDVSRADWQQARALGDTCALSGELVAADANGDGCLDIVDVQALAAAAAGTAASAPESATSAQTHSLSSAITASAVYAHTFQVTSPLDTADAAPGNGVCADANGNCTLRAAMAEADYLIGQDLITFNLPSPAQIQLSGRLPLITSLSGGVTIDGYTQPGAAVNTATVGSDAVPGVSISGNGSSLKEVAFFITSPNNVLRGLAINNIWRTIFMDGANAHDNYIVGNWIGYNANGSNNGGSGYGVINNVGANHNFIGTPALADRNLIGNFQKGIDNYGPGTDFNTIQNNVFCMGPTGFTTATCSSAVDHDFGPKNELLGGAGPNERNVMGPTLLQGIEYSHGWNPTNQADQSVTYQINNNSAIGNWVGFRGDGSYNSAYRSGLNFSSADNDQGINVYDGSNNNLIEGNYIASVYDGIQMEAPNANNNIARNNIIGVSPLGQPAPLTGWGVKIRWGTTHDVIEGNTIRNAAAGGIGLVNTTNTGNPISVAYNIRLTRNIVTDTNGLAIQLFGDANSSLVPPVIASATTTTVSGTAVGNATVEVYHATRPAGQNGLPDAYLGSTVATSGGAWTFTMPAGFAVGDRVTALQIRTDDTTSQLANNVAATSSVSSAPAFTSANATTFIAGAANSFTVTATGNPPPTITETGALPTGVTFIDNGNGTGTLSGTPTSGTAGTFSLTFTAANQNPPNATQSFTLTVKTTPAITSGNATTFVVGTAGSFTVTATGNPLPTITRTGTLPSGVAFIDNGNGTGTLSGTPASGTAGTYPITFTATNGTPPNATQNFTLTVTSPQVVPGQPAAPNAQSGPGKGITVRWTAPSNAGPPITSYLLRRYLACNLGSTPTAISTGNVLSYKDGSTTRGSSYCYTVAAANSVGPGSYSTQSNTVVATK